RDEDAAARHAGDHRILLFLLAAAGRAATAARVVIAARGDHQRERRAEHDERESRVPEHAASSSWGYCRWRARRSWSRYTAMIRTAPTATCCQNAWTPMITKPFWSTAGMKTPKTVPR